MRPELHQKITLMYLPAVRVGEIFRYDKKFYKRCGESFKEMGDVNKPEIGYLFEHETTVVAIRDR